MGSIRQRYIKATAKKLIQLYPNEFTTDFETNKRLVEQYTDVESKKVRNRIAGYLVRLVRSGIREQAQLLEEEEEQYDNERETFE